MLRKFIYGAACALCALSLASCEDEPDDIIVGPDPAPKSVGAYILNQGTQGYGIPGSLSFIGYNGKDQQEIFKAANGRVLGSTPQCAVAYGSRIYIGDSQSNLIEIIDANTYKSQKTISLATAEANTPRSMVAKDGKVYISMYTGQVCRLDTASLAIDATVAVGPNPDKIAIHGNYLYVPNSDGLNWMVGYGTTASKIDLGTFKVVKTFDVALNPTEFISNGTDLFLLCMGNYYDVPSTIYAVKADDTLQPVAEANIMAISDNTLYYIYSPWGEPEPKCYAYDIRSKSSARILTGNFVAAPVAMAYDSVAGTLVVTSNNTDPGTGAADYSIPGYANVYNSDLDLVASEPTGVTPAFIFFKR